MSIMYTVCSDAMFQMVPSKCTCTHMYLVYMYVPVPGICTCTWYMCLHGGHVDVMKLIKNTVVM